MPQTIQCKKCWIILNLPGGLKPGKRLKCPRCGTRFVITESDASSASTAPGLDDATATSYEMPKQPVFQDDLPPSLGEGDLREAFDLPLVSGSARDMERGGGEPGAQAADAAALFDDKPAKRRTTAAEARSQARRCVTCGSGVPKGMSICGVCGTDQETGLRVGLEDDLAPPPPPPPSGPPIHVSVAGGLCITGSLILLVLAVIQSTSFRRGSSPAADSSKGPPSPWGLIIFPVRGLTAPAVPLLMDTDANFTTTGGGSPTGDGTPRVPDRSAR